MTNLESYFQKFRAGIIGLDASFVTPFGTKQMIYADWIASGRLYEPIEKKLCEEIGPMVGNTHSESSETGNCMTHAYHLAQKIIKEHVNASPSDVIITAGSGMTGCLAKFQRIQGLRMPENFSSRIQLEEKDRPVVFITHMEHHSNQTSWIESIADLVVLPPDDQIRIDINQLEKALEKYKDREIKIGSFTACSNVTGLKTPIHEFAKIMHAHEGYCFVDFAASAPYTDINMHPEEKGAHFDAVFFSPHKFLGGPGSSGVLVFNKELYHNRIPDHPGGGTVTWTNPWGEHQYFDDIEIREDGGTPAFLQTIRAAMAIRLKEEMGTNNIERREKELVSLVFSQLDNIPGLHILANEERDRLGVFSFYVEGIHHNLIVRLLNDMYGIQVRGGCSCAGTYGHYLLHVDEEKSHYITSRMNEGDFSLKPGWIRMSIHPTMTNKEIEIICNALRHIVQNIEDLSENYRYDPRKNEYFHKMTPAKSEADFAIWFDLKV